jgi:hypothetical protein
MHMNDERASDPDECTGHRLGQISPGRVRPARRDVHVATAIVRIAPARRIASRPVADDRSFVILGYDSPIHMTPLLDPNAREPVQRTLRRTITIAVVVGLAIALGRRNIRVWPIASMAALWFSLGGHYVELLFLRVLRSRLPAGRAVQTAARVVLWFAGGAMLGLGASATLALIGAPARALWSTLWGGAIVFVAIELVVHAVLRARGSPSMFDGRG